MLYCPQPFVEKLTVECVTHVKQYSENTDKMNMM